MRPRPERGTNGNPAPRMQVRQADHALDALKLRILVQLINRRLLNPARRRGNDLNLRFAHAGNSTNSESEN
jgi:hypothetical protein